MAASIRIAYLHLGALGGDALIFGQLKLRRGLDIGEERKCLTLFEIYLITSGSSTGLRLCPPRLCDRNR